VWVIKSRRINWVSHVTCIGVGRGVYRILVGKRDGNNPLGKPRHGCEDHIKIDLHEVGYLGMDLIELARYRAGGGHL